MKVAIVGPGIMPIPPTGWGAVEILIWDQPDSAGGSGPWTHVLDKIMIIKDGPISSEVLRPWVDGTMAHWAMGPWPYAQTCR